MIYSSVRKESIHTDAWKHQTLGQITEVAPLSTGPGPEALFEVTVNMFVGKSIKQL